MCRVYIFQKCAGSISSSINLLFLNNVFPFYCCLKLYFTSMSALFLTICISPSGIYTTFILKTRPRFRPIKRKQPSFLPCRPKNQRELGTSGPPKLLFKNGFYSASLQSSKDWLGENKIEFGRGEKTGIFSFLSWYVYTFLFILRIFIWRFASTFLPFRYNFCKIGIFFMNFRI